MGVWNGVDVIGCSSSVIGLCGCSRITPTFCVGSLKIGDMGLASSLIRCPTDRSGLLSYLIPVWCIKSGILVVSVVDFSSLIFESLVDLLKVCSNCALFPNCV